MKSSHVSIPILALLACAPGYGASLPAPWGALSTGTASVGPSGVFENWVLANSFEDQTGLSEAIMVANEQQNVTTQLVSVGTGILSFGPFGISFTGSNLAPGHPYNPKPTDTISVGGGGFSVPLVIEQAVLDDQYSASMTATARTQGGSVTDPESSTGNPASTSATAVFGPTPGGSTATPFTTIFYSASVTVSINGGPAQSLFSGAFSLDSSGAVTTSGNVVPSDITATPTGFAFAAPITFSQMLTAPNESFTFNYQSVGDLITIATPEPPPVTTLFLAFTVAALLGKRLQRFVWRGGGEAR